MSKSKPPPPDPDDPRCLRTCNLCGEVRRWVEPVCKCGGVEFSIPEDESRDESHYERREA